MPKEYSKLFSFAGVRNRRDVVSEKVWNYSSNNASFSAPNFSVTMYDESYGDEHYESNDVWHNGRGYYYYYYGNGYSYSGSAPTSHVPNRNVPNAPPTDGTKSMPIVLLVYVGEPNFNNYASVNPKAILDEKCTPPPVPEPPAPATPVSASSYCSTPSNYYWWEVGVGFVSGLKTGGKAVVNGLVAAAKQAVTLNLYEKYEGVFTYTEQDIANGAQLSEGIANASGSILIGAGTGWAGCAGGKVGQAVKAFDMASDAVGAAQSIEDIHDNGLNATNALGLIGSTGGLATNGLSACFTEGTQIVIGVEYPAELCSCEIICADYHSEDCGVFYVTTNIENIKVGDYVLAQDVETGEVSLKEVTDTFVRTSDHLRYLTTIDEEGDTQTIETTDGHPFWVVTDNPDLSRAAGDFVVENGTILYHENLAITEHGYYVEAKDLRVGDVFLGANGELTTLTGTERVEFPNGVTVYNFTVADNHNYYVIANLEAYENGASVVLVHNASGIYEFFDKKNAGKKYVGQASDLDARLKQHKAAGRIEDIKDAIKTEMPESDKLAREIAEHNRIQELTNGMPSRFSDSVSNKRDPIGPARIHLLNEGGSI